MHSGTLGTTNPGVWIQPRVWCGSAIRKKPSCTEEGGVTASEKRKKQQKKFECIPRDRTERNGKWKRQHQCLRAHEQSHVTPATTLQERRAKK